MSWYEWQLDGQSLTEVAVHELKVTAAHPGRGNLDQHLVRSYVRYGYFFDLQRLVVAVRTCRAHVHRCLLGYRNVSHAAATWEKGRSLRARGPCSKCCSKCAVGEGADAHRSREVLDEAGCLPRARPTLGAGT